MAGRAAASVNAVPEAASLLINQAGRQNHHRAVFLVREYDRGDAGAITGLFHPTVHTINLKDYCAQWILGGTPEIPYPEAWHVRIQLVGGIEVVTADGELHTLTQQRDAHLWWVCQGVWLWILLAS